VGIYTNKSTIPFDERPPYVGSGVRLGTPWLTSRGMGPDEMRQIACLMSRVLENREDEVVKGEVRQEVEKMASAFPAPGISDGAGVTG
jgi:glycine hydroxymethyltransferase